MEKIEPTERNINILIWKIYVCSLVSFGLGLILGRGIS